MLWTNTCYSDMHACIITIAWQLFVLWFPVRLVRCGVTACKLPHTFMTACESSDSPMQVTYRTFAVQSDMQTAAQIYDCISAK